jgi:hypothetical protein
MEKGSLSLKHWRWWVEVAEGDFVLEAQNDGLSVGDGCKCQFTEDPTR